MGKTHLATLISIIAVQNRNSPYSVYLGYGSFKRIYIYYLGTDFDIALVF